MLSWFKGLISRSYYEQEKGFRRTASGVIAPEELYETRMSDSGVRVDQQNVYGIPAYKRAVELIANKVSGCKCHVLKRLPNGGRDHAKEHWAYPVLRRQANPSLSPDDLIKQLVQDAITVGNGYSVIYNRQLWCLEPSNVTPVVVHEKERQTLVYKVQYEGGTDVFDASEIIHIKGLTYRAGLVGMSLIDYASETLGLSIAAQKYASAFYRFGGVADAWIEIPDGAIIEPEEVDKMQKWLHRKYTGVTNTHAPIVLTGGARLNKSQLNNGDAQHLESRNLTLTDVANLVGLPLSKVNGANGYGYGSLQADNAAVLGDSYEPWLRVLEHQFNDKLLAESEKEDYYVEFDRTDLTKGDPQSELNLWVTRYNNNLVSWEEYRKATNQPIDIIGKEHFKNDLEEQRLNPTPQPEAAAPIETSNTEEQRNALTRATVERLVTRLKKDEPKNKDELITRHRDVFLDSLPGAKPFIDSFLDSLGNELESVLPEQRKSVLARLDIDTLAEDVWKV